MKPNISCRTCIHAIYEAVAGDDRRGFCGNANISPPIGYLSETAIEALSCRHYLAGNPREEDLLIVAEPRSQFIPAGSLIGFGHVGN
jgi:hypothetical protein